MGNWNPAKKWHNTRILCALIFNGEKCPPFCFYYRSEISLQIMHRKSICYVAGFSSWNKKGRTLKRIFGFGKIEVACVARRSGPRPLLAFRANTAQAQSPVLYDGLDMDDGYD